jgi:hypothetical protein
VATNSLATCWWLSQTGALEWRLRLESLMTPAKFRPTPTSSGKEAECAACNGTCVYDQVYVRIKVRKRYDVKGET